MRRGLLMAIVYVTTPAQAFPAPLDQPFDVAGQLRAFTVTVVLAAILGLGLFYFSRRSSQRGARVAEVDPADVMSWKETDAIAFRANVMQQLQALPGPPAHKQQTAQGITDLVHKEMGTRVSQVKQEVRQAYVHIIQERAQTEAAIRERYQSTLLEKKQTEAVLHSLAEGLIVVNAQGSVVMMNPAAERLLQLTQEQQLGKSILDSIKEEQLFSLVKETKAGGREIELTAGADKTKRVLRSSSAVVEDENGQTVGMVSVLSDVTKQRELDQLKSDFLSKVTHELRTPIASIQHALALLLEGAPGPLTDTQKEFLSLTDRNLTRLKSLVDDLLDLAKLEARKMALNLRPCAIHEVGQAACASFAAWAASKQIRLETELQPDLPHVMVDPDRITQVLQNLIGNALKFTPTEGRVRVTARRHATEGTIEIRVEDTGVGIAPEHLPRVFEKFQQFHTHAAKTSGTGLGLSIVKELVELHGGHVSVTSEPGKGSCFTVLLPLTVPTPVGG